MSGKSMYRLEMRREFPQNKDQVRRNGIGQTCTDVINENICEKQNFCPPGV